MVTFGNRPHKLVCTWHVDHAWRENLHQLKDNELKSNVYHNLRVLLEQQDKDRFEILLDLTLNELFKSSFTASFVKYFEIHYAKNKEQWVTCYRKGTLLNTNMFVEAFHRVLKCVHERKSEQKNGQVYFCFTEIGKSGLNVSLNWKKEKH